MDQRTTWADFICKLINYINKNFIKITFICVSCNSVKTAATGGLLRLGFGFSMVSATEIFYFILVRWLWVGYRERKRNRIQSVTPVVPFGIGLYPDIPYPVVRRWSSSYQLLLHKKDLIANLWSEIYHLISKTQTDAINIFSLFVTFLLLGKEQQLNVFFSTCNLKCPWMLYSVTLYTKYNRFT